MHTPRKILIIAPNWIGDCLMAQPLFARLKAKLGEVRLHVLCPAWVAPVLKRMPELDEVISTPFVHGPLQLKERWKLGRAFARLGYTQAIVLPNSWKSALLPFFADIPLRIGYVGESRYALLNVLHKSDKKAWRPMVEHYGQLAEMPQASKAPAAPTSGSNVAAGTATGLLLPPTLAPKLRRDPAATVVTLAKLGLSSHPGKGGIAAFCIGAEFGPAKRWPAAHWAALADLLLVRGAQVWLLGTQAEAPIAAAIEQLVTQTGIRNLCGKTTLDDAINLLGAASVAVSNDSGLMHVAAALDTPLVALFGSSSSTHTPPQSALAQIAEISGLPCRPCFQRTCPLGHFKCMNELKPGLVLGMLDAEPPQTLRTPRTPQA